MTENTPPSDDAPAESLGVDEVGAVDGDLPFRFHPAAHLSPLIVSVPHAGLEWPAKLTSRPHVNLARNADFGVDQLVADAPSLGAATIVARYSRLVVDLNRAPDDVSPRVVADHPDPRPRVRPGYADELISPRRLANGELHRGVVWDTAIGNISVLARPLAYDVFEQRLAAYHRPYWNAVEILLARRVVRFGYAILLDAHSMPGSVGTDIVLGTIGGRSCGPELTQRAVDALAAPALQIRVDRPYPGGALVARFGRPQSGIHALQVEVSRALYMDELGLRMLDPTTGSARGASDRLSSAPDPVSLLSGRLASLVRALAGAPAPASSAQ